jgi:hypothetical protein
LIHVVEMAFERIEVGRPEAPEGSEPRINLPERFRPETIDAALGFDTGLYEAGVTQDAKVFGHRRLRHP